jgi:hypothetical protein
MLARRRAFRVKGGGRGMEIERATCRRYSGGRALSNCSLSSAGVQVPRKPEATPQPGRRARMRDEMYFGRGRPTAGRVLNTNDCSAVWNGKRASRGKGCVCPPPGSATSAGAEKRFELFTRNSVEPSAGCAPCERPRRRRLARELIARPAPRVSNSLALPDTHALRPDVSRLSPATADGLLSRSAQKKRALDNPSTASNISSTIAEPLPATLQKNVSRLCEVQT